MTTAGSRLLVAAALAAAGALGIAATSSAPASPSAATATSCTVRGQERGLGPTYVTTLSVSHTSCAQGKRLVRAYYRCRRAHGGRKGRCPVRVLRYRCRERRTSIPTQFDAKVTCRRGRAVVRHTYTQFT